MDKVMDELDIKTNYPPAGAHVPEAERNNRTIGEAIRTCYNRLPYKTMPRLMWIIMALECTEKLNFFPVKGGVSDYYSPHVIMKKETLEYKKDFKFGFGAYVLAYMEDEMKKNTSKPRAIDAIFLRNMKNIQGGHEVMNLNTGRRVTAQQVHERPITTLIIERVEQMGIDQGFKSLKLESKKRTPLFPAHYEDGVDYEFDNEDEDFEDYPDEDDESDDEMEGISQEEIQNLGNQNDEVANEELDDIYTNTPNIMEGSDEAIEAEEDETKSEEKIESRVRPSRTIIPVERLTYTHQQSDVKKVTFKDPVS
jgi:hypothetical protein